MNYPSIVWNDIEDYKGLYQISTRGDVRSVDRTVNYSNGRFSRLKGKILKPKVHRDGYLMVELRKNRKSKTFFIHRLVAQAFIPNPENKPQVNHVDFCRDCNWVENLEWVTAQENIQHAVRNGRGNSNVGSKNIRAVYVEGCDCCFISIRDAAGYLNLSYGHVQAVLSGKRRNTIGIEYCG